MDRMLALKRFGYLLATVLGVATSGCSEQQIARGEARKSVRFLLNDPDSAKFQLESLHHTKAGTAYCGFVNWRTPMGGYGGDRVFYVLNGSAHVSGNGGLINFDDSEWEKVCEMRDPEADARAEADRVVARVQADEAAAKKRRAK